MNNNKVAIVTGGAKNIGRATCVELAKLNFNILIHANTDKTGAQETKSLVDDQKVNSRVLIGDLAWQFEALNVEKLCVPFKIAAPFFINFMSNFFLICQALFLSKASVDGRLIIK